MNPPNQMLCPTTGTIMVDQYMDKNGHNFEKHAIQMWPEMRDLCPLGCMHRLVSTGLVQNAALQCEIQEFTLKFWLCKSFTQT